jgi:hypothetical protein
MTSEERRQAITRMCVRLVEDNPARQELGQIGMRLLDEVRRYVRLHPTIVLDDPDTELTIEQLEYVLAAVLGQIVGGIDDSASATTQYERIQRLTHIIAFTAAFTFQLGASHALRDAAPITRAVN